MILTQCACCAAPLPHLAKQCSRYKTRYCGPACQEQHWKEGGHDKLCKKIRRGGGAEQYHADTKYKEAVAVAAEACVEDTKGQACYICTEAVHRHTKEGLVRGCACYTTEGFVHVSCLAEQAKILREEAEENNLDIKVLGETWLRWHTCSLCKQQYHGIVSCALGWACWKTYLGRPEGNITRSLAMNVLGNGLYSVNLHADVLSVQEAELAMMQRVGATQAHILGSQGNIAQTYGELGRSEQSICMRRDVYSGFLRLEGEEHEATVSAAYNYVVSLVDLQRFEEAKALLRKMIPVARRALGENHDLTLMMRKIYAVALYRDTGATLDNLREAVTTIEDTERIARRVLGGSHPHVVDIERDLQKSRAALRARDGDYVSSIREAVGAMTTGGA